MPNQNLITLAGDIRSWMFGAALPFWSERGIDRAHGGYVESFDLALEPMTDLKRVRVIGRQMYVFSHASLLGFQHGLALSEHGYRFLVENAWLGPDGGWARSLNRDGSVRDATPDLYDIAFVLFALGWHARASGSSEPLGWAHRTLDFLDAHMRHPSGEGFHNERGGGGPRLQNPHMHLLEASLVLLDVAPRDERFRTLADELVSLFARRFYDPATRTIAEYFTDDWSRAPGPSGRWIEPGHQFEWAWILAQHQRLTGQDNRALARGLVMFSEEHGVDRTTGMTYNGVRDDGIPLNVGSRDWPNTERIKAAVALYELDGRDPWTIIEQSSRLLLGRYLNVSQPGTWIGAFDSEGRPVIDKIAASSFYHLFLAFSEALRIMPGGAVASARS